MATPRKVKMATNGNGETTKCSYAFTSDDCITADERDIMTKRIGYIKNYRPPRWRSNQPDPVSGDFVEVAMTTRASILIRHGY